MSYRSPWTAYLHNFIYLLLFILCPLTSFSQDAMPSTYVVDNAGIINKDVKQLLSMRLRELEDKTGAQMIILTVQTTEGIPIEDYALKKAEDWKLGQKGKDNGLLLVVSVTERKYRFEVGYGLEAVLPDSLVGSIGREVLVPHFRSGEYTEGIHAASVAMTDIIARSQGVTLSSGQPRQRAPAKDRSGLESAVFLFIFLIVIPFIQRLRHKGSSYWRRGSYGGFGTFGRGGFGGGGFGGFGGGGGGGFGGGGSSGGW